MGGLVIGLLMVGGLKLGLDGLPVIGGFQNVTVTKAGIWGSVGARYLEVEIPANIFPFKAIEADVSKVEVKVDPSAPGTLVSSKDWLIWGRRWGVKVNHLLITVRTEELKQEWENKLTAAMEEPKPKDIVP